MSRFAFGFIVALALTAPAAADTAPPAKPPTLAELYDRLAVSKTDAEAAGLVRAISKAQLQSGSDTADLLMSRALAAIEAKRLDTAIDLLTAILHQSPEYTEAWNKRSFVYYMKNQYSRSVADIAQTLKRDPRHFGAWAGLGHIYVSGGDKKRALEAYRKALAIHPYLAKLREAIERLTPEIDGRDI